MQASEMMSPEEASTLVQLANASRACAADVGDMVMAYENATTESKPYANPLGATTAHQTVNTLLAVFAENIRDRIKAKKEAEKKAKAAAAA